MPRKRERGPSSRAIPVDREYQKSGICEARCRINWRNITWRNFPHAHGCISRVFYGTEERTYEAIQGIFIVAPLFGRVRTVLLHTDIDDVCRVTSGTADPPGCRGNSDKLEEGGFFVVVCELGLHFLVDAEAGGGVCCYMTTVLTNSPVCYIRGIDLVAIDLPRAVEGKKY